MDTDPEGGTKPPESGVRFRQCRKLGAQKTNGSGRAGAAGNSEVRWTAMGVRCVAIHACRRGKIDTGVPRMAVRACGAAAAVVALLSAAIALQWSPLHAGTGRGRLCLALAHPAPGNRWDRPA